MNPLTCASRSPASAGGTQRGPPGLATPQNPGVPATVSEDVDFLQLVGHFSQGSTTLLQRAPAAVIRIVTGWPLAQTSWVGGSPHCLASRRTLNHSFARQLDVL